MLSLLLIYQPSQICLSSIQNASIIGYPITKNVLIDVYGATSFDDITYYNRIENICLCSNERTKNGISYGNTSNGICEDYDNITQNAVYDFGTDCDDCGARGNYPSFNCMGCAEYINNYPENQYINNDNNIFCITPRGNILTPNLYYSYYKFDNKLTLLTDETEVCRLYVLENGNKIPFNVITDNDIVIYTKRNGFSGKQERSIINSMNVTGSYNTDPELLISIREDTHFAIHYNNITYNLYIGIERNIIPFTNFRFENDFAIVTMKEISHNNTFDSYIPYYMMNCTAYSNDYVTVNDDCTLSSNRSKLYLKDTRNIDQYPFIVNTSFPKYDSHVPIVRFINNTFSGFIETNFKYLQENRSLLEFYINTEELHVLEMYGFKVRFTNMIPINRTYCHMSMQSSHNNILERKNDMGAKNNCIWSHKNKITSINVENDLISTVYAKIPASYDILGPESNHIFLFGIEMQYDPTTVVSIRMEEIATTILLSNKLNKPSEACNTQYDTITTKSLIVCKSNKILTSTNNQELLVESIAVTESASIPENVQESVISVDDTICLNNNTEYTANSIQFGIFSSGLFIPIGPILTSINCFNSSILFDGDNLKNTAQYNPCLINQYISKVDDTYRKISCCSCEEYYFPPISPTAIHPPLSPPAPPMPPITPTVYPSPSMPIINIYPSPPPLNSNFTWIFSSVEHCSTLLNLQEVDYFLVRTSAASRTIIQSISNTEEYSESCLMFTNHQPNIKIQNIIPKNYTFVPGYQYAPIMNWTSLQENQGLFNFDAHIQGNTYTYPGNNTNLLNFQAFIMKVYAYTQALIEVPSA